MDIITPQIQSNSCLYVKTMGEEEDLLREMYIGHCNYID